MLSASGPPRLSARLLRSHLLVVFVGAGIPVLVAQLAAPNFFHTHLSEAGVEDPEALMHAETAFQDSLWISVSMGVVAALIVASLASWLLSRRLARPFELLASAAHQVAAGQYSVSLQGTEFSEEVNELGESFRAMAEQLAASDESRALLLADLAHEVRTPLATLQAYVDGLEDGVIPVDSAAFETMRIQIERMKRLSSDIKEVANAEAQTLTLERIDAREAIASAALSVSLAFSAKGVELQAVRGLTPLVIDADDLRVQQVLAILLDNALRHTPAGGRVSIDGSASGTSISITVKDSGDGIPAEELERIFERLHRVDPARASAGGGGGLGLTIARTIAQRHGGTLNARSTGPGHGSSFELQLPAARPASR